MPMHSEQAKAAQTVKSRFPNFTPKIGIVLGSGLGKLAEHIDDAHHIPYDELPGFDKSTVVGHAGRLVIGYLKGVPVACLQGRLHYYEGVSNPAIQILIRTLKLLGCEILIATNAAGSLNPEVGPGNLVLIKDHINFQFHNPLVGANHDEFGPRFIAMENAYDPSLREIMLQTAAAQDIKLYQGVYFGVLGPSFETPAEIKAFRILGGDVVGMSTISEVIVARHCGLRVVVVSAITNYAAGLSDVELSHEETLRHANMISTSMIRLIESFIAKLKDE
mgnify:CR=1 FL=1